MPIHVTEYINIMKKQTIKVCPNYRLRQTSSIPSEQHPTSYLMNKHIIGSFHKNSYLIGVINKLRLKLGNKLFDPHPNFNQTLLFYSVFCNHHSFFYLCIVLMDKMFLPTHKEDLINPTAQINNFPLSFSKIIRTN
jgi:hypothetical protein